MDRDPAEQREGPAMQKSVLSRGKSKRKGPEAGKC